VSVRSERQVQALRLAQACCELGARARTVHHLTGLGLPELQRLFFADARLAPRGRAPDSPEWYHATNLLNRAEASIFASVYRRLRSGGFGAAWSLVTACRQYRSLCQTPHRITFDRAFDLASHLDDIWVARTAALSVVQCATCGSEYLASRGAIASASEHCPFCRLRQRFACDKRLRNSFPSKPVSDVRALQAAVAAMMNDPGTADPENGFDRPPLFGDPWRAESKNGTCSS
jgi:flagellar transcriptional activator FlhC